MLIIKSALKCNTINSPSNKGEIYQKLIIDPNKVAKHYNDIGVVVTKPFLDKLEFGFYPTQPWLNQFDPTENIEDYKNYLKQSLFFDAKVGTDHGTLSAVKDVSFFDKPYCWYNVNLWYRPMPSSARYSYKSALKVRPQKEHSSASTLTLQGIRWRRLLVSGSLSWTPCWLQAMDRRMTSF